MIDDSTNRLAWLAVGLALIASVFTIFNVALPAIGTSVVNKVGQSITNTASTTVQHTAYAYSADGTDRFSAAYPGLNWLKGTKIPVSFVGTNSVNKTGTIYTFDNGQNLSNQDFEVGDLITFEFDWSAIDNTNAQTGMLRLQWNNSPWTGSTIVHVSNANKSGHVKFTYTIATAEKNSFATGIAYRLDSVPTTTTIVISNLTVRKTDSSEPWMPAESEVQPSDYPNYVGTYTDTSQSASTDPTKYFWSKNN